MVTDIIALLKLFEGRLPDGETHAWVVDLASHEDRWSEAHDVFDRIRDRNLAAIARKDRASECQYCFEEACLKSLFNETDTGAPFDSSSPHWIIKTALVLARTLGMPDTSVVEVVSPREKPNKTPEPTPGLVTPRALD